MKNWPSSIWQVASIEHEPHASLMSWRVFKVRLKDEALPTLHLVGYAIEAREGRVSSAIQAFDLDKMLVRTASDRIYWLRGEPGYDGRAEFVWREWLVATGATLIDEVTQTLSERASRRPPTCGA